MKFLILFIQADANRAYKKNNNNVEKLKNYLRKRTTFDQTKNTCTVNFVGYLYK